MRGGRAVVLIALSSLVPCASCSPRSSSRSPGATSRAPVKAPGEHVEDVDRAEPTEPTHALPPTSAAEAPSEPEPPPPPLVLKKKQHELIGYGGVERGPSSHPPAWTTMRESPLKPGDAVEVVLIDCAWDEAATGAKPQRACKARPSGPPQGSLTGVHGRLEECFDVTARPPTRAEVRTIHRSWREATDELSDSVKQPSKPESSGKPLPFNQNGPRKAGPVSTVTLHWQAPELKGPKPVFALISLTHSYVGATYGPNGCENAPPERNCLPIRPHFTGTEVKTQRAQVVGRTRSIPERATPFVFSSFPAYLYELELGSRDAAQRFTPDPRLDIQKPRSGSLTAYYRRKLAAVDAFPRDDLTPDLEAALINNTALYAAGLGDITRLREAREALRRIVENSSQILPGDIEFNLKILDRFIAGDWTFADPCEPSVPSAL